ncbi:CRTAC1 family protein [Granulicella arctica]|uniref:CRTAC1 family protein n=1 Tax=Granulicella arctica TaxID=940613 RepID=UPI0021DFC7CB|nr:CRTAC1 family protein [Granulicella arctica]
MHRPSRREFVSALAATVPLAALRRMFPATIAPPVKSSITALFEPVLPAQSGIIWSHVNGRSPAYYLPETTGAGCAFLDYDNDGWMDIFLVNSGACDFFTPAKPLRNALYRNNRDGTFTDVTLKAGVADAGYGMGAAVGDYNNDGLPDLFVTSYNRSILYRNNGDGTFTDVTLKSGISTPGWASSAVWFDYDNDGRLDLFVCRFVEFDKGSNKFCGNEGTGERHYCIPRIYPPTHSWLFHNNGDGTFTDVSAATGINAKAGKAWGVVATDINNDGHMDLFVANDTVANFLWMNHQGKFKDEGLEGGVAYSSDGHPRSGMGVDAADLDQDGWQDLTVTNVDQEMYSVYHNNKDGTFDDLSPMNGIGAATRSMSGWGLRFFDYDNDGNLDLFIANGHPDDQIEVHSGSVTYREPLLLFHNDGVTLKNISASAGPIFRESLAARGLALGDFDNDGAVDVLISTNNGAPLLLKNLAAKGNHWLGLKLVGRKANVDAIGAQVTWKAGTLRRSRLKSAGGSYLSSHDPRMVLGIGTHTKLDQLEIRWPAPSTRVDTFTELPIDRYITIIEEEGIVR